MLQVALSLALLVGSVSAAGQEQPAQATRQLPAPTDIDPQLTEQLRRQEQNLADAILRKDADALDRLVGQEYTLRVGDVPQSPGGLPRAIWMANTLSSGRTKAESVDLRDCVARRLADDLAVVSLIHDQKRRSTGEISLASSTWWISGSNVMAGGKSPRGIPVRWDIKSTAGTVRCRRLMMSTLS